MVPQTNTAFSIPELFLVTVRSLLRSFVFE